MSKCHLLPKSLEKHLNNGNSRGHKGQAKITERWWQWLGAKAQVRQKAVTGIFTTKLIYVMQDKRETQVVYPEIFRAATIFCHAKIKGGYTVASYQGRDANKRCKEDAIVWDQSSQQYILYLRTSSKLVNIPFLITSVLQCKSSYLIINCILLLLLLNNLIPNGRAEQWVRRMTFKHCLTAGVMCGAVLQMWSRMPGRALWGTWPEWEWV
ncbi:hypothetical protein L218DRAFT_950578 [Marasmius fiardii PR-910]|nr:hypothetical protein L218DRAFT_950578 [Marasmius fiardii PR-910]